MSDQIYITIKSKLNPKYNFLLRTGFYEELIDEVISKTIQAIQEENKTKLSENERAIFNKRNRNGGNTKNNKL